MKKILPFLIILINFILIGQNDNSNIWTGISVSTSDNLDALSFNPAGLGVDRGTQFALNIQQSHLFDPNNKNIYILSLATRFGCGLAFQHEFDEINRYSWTVGYGNKLFNNFYTGIKYHESRDYSVGFLYRPFNYLSSGLTMFTNKDDSYRYIRYGISLRPNKFLKATKRNSDKFLSYSNFTIGYDKLVNYDSDWKDSDYKEYYFLSFNIVPGLNMAVQRSIKSSYAINLSMNLGNNGIHMSNYPSNELYTNSSTSSGIGFYTYSQKQKSRLNFLNSKKDNYVLLELEGYFIEEKPNKSPFSFDVNIDLLSLSGDNLEGVQLKSFVDKINEITLKKNITGLIIKLGDIKAGFGKRKEIYNAFMNLKNNGKKIIVYTDKNYINGFDYYLISMADEIYTSEHTGVGLKGINMELSFIRGLLDTIYIVPEVVRVSPYKSAFDMLLNKKMSKEVKENYGKLLDDYYDIMIEDISNGRNWSVNETKSIVDAGPYYLTSNAIRAGLIDSTMYPDNFEDFIDSKKNHIIKWNSIKTSDYYIHDWVPEKTPKVAVIYAVGGIMSGESNPGPTGSTIMGDETITKAIRKAREDDSIKSIVLRIDSGGGSVLASDMIWREIELTTNPDSEDNKPVIVSMSDVAASGGYYIGCEADYIMASPSTVTGSIGVIWARINFSKLLEKIGINFDGLKKGKNADFGSGTHLLTDSEKERIFNTINSEYQRFKEKVINGRNTLSDIDALDNIALGKIWSGKEALEIGLIDGIGGIHDAIEIAKSKAGIIATADVNIEEFPKVNPFSFFEIFNKSKVTSVVNLKNILPDDLAEQLEVFDLLPVILDNNIQLLMPYKIILD